ncbi:MAG: hypothetical protein RL115_448, partial [Bacteroidota bacterium]
RPADEFKAAMDHWIEGFRNAKPQIGYDKVLVPGDPEREFEAERMVKGIPLLDAVVEDLQSLSEKLGLSPL